MHNVCKSLGCATDHNILKGYKVSINDFMDNRIKLRIWGKSSNRTYLFFPITISNGNSSFYLHRRKN